MVVSNADPKRTFLGLVDAAELPGRSSAGAIAGIKMDGPCAKVNLVLSEEPRVRGMPRGVHDAAARPLHARALARVRGALLRRSRASGEIPEELWVDCVVASNVDPSARAQGRHVMTCFVQYVPYRLQARATWDEKRELLGDRVVAQDRASTPRTCRRRSWRRQVLTPLDLERTYGLTEGNIFHGDLSLEQLFFMRPVPGWARYRTPVDGLYLCGAGAHPGGGVTGAPGHNAARQVLKDWKRDGVA